MPLRKLLHFYNFPTMPDNFHDVLTEFTIACMVEKPDDVINYAVKYFTKYQADRKKTLSEVEIGMLGDVEELITTIDEELPSDLRQRLSKRRESVYTESFDPSKDEPAEIAESIYPKSPELYNRLAQTVQNMFFFRSLNDEQQRAIFDAMFERVVKENEIIFHEGEDGSYFFIIESGQYTATIGNSIVAKFKNFGSFGEMALLYNSPRPFTIKANMVGKLWAMDRETFRKILLKSVFKKHQIYDKFIDSVIMFKILSPYDRKRLADGMISLTFKLNEQILKQGDAPKGIFFIEMGMVSVRKILADGSEVEILQMGEGEHFGGLTLMINESMQNSFRAASDDVKLAFLDVETFERLVGPCTKLINRSIEKITN